MATPRLGGARVDCSIRYAARRHLPAAPSRASGDHPSMPRLRLMTTITMTETAARSSSANIARITLVLCLVSNVFAGMLATLMAAYLPDTVRDLTGMTDAATVGYVGSRPCRAGSCRTRWFRCRTEVSAARQANRKQCHTESSSGPT